MPNLPPAKIIDPLALARNTLHLSNRDAWDEITDQCLAKTRRLRYETTTEIWCNRLKLREKIKILARQKQAGLPRARPPRQDALMQAIDPTGKNRHPRRWLQVIAMYAQAEHILGDGRLVQLALREAREQFYGLKPAERADLFNRTVRMVAVRYRRHLPPPAPPVARLPWHD